MKPNDFLVKGNDRHRVIQVLGENGPDQVVFLKGNKGEVNLHGLLVGTSECFEEEGFKLEEKEPERWKPKEGKQFWFVNFNGEIFGVPWVENPTTQNILDFGNYFPSEADATAAALRVKKALRGEEV